MKQLERQLKERRAALLNENPNRVANDPQFVNHHPEALTGEIQQFLGRKRIDPSAFRVSVPVPGEHGPTAQAFQAAKQDKELEAALTNSILERDTSCSRSGLPPKVSSTGPTAPMVCSASAARRRASTRWSVRARTCGRGHRQGKLDHVRQATAATCTTSRSPRATSGKRQRARTTPSSARRTAGARPRSSGRTPSTSETRRTATGLRPSRWASSRRTPNGSARRSCSTSTVGTTRRARRGAERCRRGTSSATPSSSTRSGATPDLESFQNLWQTGGVPAVSELERMLRGASLRVTRPRVAVLAAVHEHPHADTQLDPRRRARASSATCPSRPSTTC